MKRLTTPTHEFTFDIDPREWSGFLITYKQGKDIVLEKSDKDEHSTAVNEDGTYKLSYRLTQHETKAFRAGMRCDIQVRSVYANGDAIASDIVSIDVEDVLDGKILGDES